MGNPKLYGAKHQAERKEADAALVSGGPRPCRRCGQPVHPDRHRHLNWDGRKFDLGHPEPGQTTKEPEHNTCNRKAGGRKGRRRQLQPASEEWW